MGPKSGRRRRFRSRRLGKKGIDITDSRMLNSSILVSNYVKQSEWFVEKGNCVLYKRMCTNDRKIPTTKYFFLSFFPPVSLTTTERATINLSLFFAAPVSERDEEKHRNGKYINISMCIDVRIDEIGHSDG